MSKKILMFIAAVLLVGMSIPAFAAVENVKVGGDITIRGIYRSNLTLPRKLCSRMVRAG